jgi:hydroxymethylglutaryl-CoA reductase (NADPH)
MKIPSLILRQLYTFGSLENASGAVRFSLKNRLSDGTLTGIDEVRFDGEPVALDSVTLELSDGRRLAATAVSRDESVSFPLRSIVQVEAARRPLDKGKHKVGIGFVTEPFGRLELTVQDSISEQKVTRPSVPYDKENDYTPTAIDKRQEFVERFSGVKPEHVWNYSFDASTTRGNIENFTGAAQVPIGFAGPLTIKGEHAQGDFLIPMATTEGTLVASYNRGIKVINSSGGVTCTVVGDRMQRAPVFVFDSAREARDFKNFVQHNCDEIRDAAEATSSVAKLEDIDAYLSNRFTFLRFNYTTGDAAGQNMVGRATFAACSWILERVKSVRKFYLESNLATDKKASQINVMRTRGKRVVAEATVPRDALIEQMRVEPEGLFYHYNVANVGALLSGANNNGCHSPNAIAAMFIATGQDVANVSESSAGILYAELTPERDLYMSLTIPSLIVGTYGGGTGLATQRECLEIMDCHGRGKVNKLAEIVAGVALAGELSLASAISSLDWVSSHEEYGRNR